MFSRLGVISRRLGNVTRNSLAVVGLGTSFYALSQRNEYQKLDLDLDDDQKKDKRKKKVLVIPFHKLRIVERKIPPSLSTILNSASSSPSSHEDKLQQIELRTLIDTIHQAAQDPNIVALYGTFGSGFRFSCGGYAHLEEIRNAIRVFNESHRTHYEPQRGQKHPQKDTNKMGFDFQNSEKSFPPPPLPSSSPQQKYSYAYADTFDHPIDSLNQEYYLASAFSKVQMQPRGNLHLFGLSTSQIFLKKSLDKYGIKAHVFKHGQYKNAPNIFTERKYTKSHFENTKSIIDSINDTVHTSIAEARNIYDQFNPQVWGTVHDYGTLSAQNAQEVNLIDYLPRIDPLHELVALNKYDNDDSSNPKKKDDDNYMKDRIEYLRKSWTWFLNEQKDEKFIANETILLDDYVKTLHKKEKWMKRTHGWNKMIEDLVAKSSAAEALFDSIGWKAPYYNVKKSSYNLQYINKSKDKIAIVHISGGIDDAIARNVVDSLQKIKKDKHTKAVILRVDSPGGSVTASETILEQCKDVQKPIICSFANVAASGGYYISAYADRIFASPTTITGSIGVFGIKLDASKFARSYGIEVDFISSGKHASTYNTLHPLTKKMRLNLQRNIDKFYAYFKLIVSQGRDIPLEEVEKVAQGRVWTGAQAKEVRLVDEWGGIDRAVSYAKRKYTLNGYADVEVYPKPLTWKDQLMKLSQMETDALVMDDHGEVYNKNEFCFENSSEDPLMKTSSYDGLMQLILKGDVRMMNALTRLPHAGRVLLTIDESTAVHQILKEALQGK